MTNPPPSLPPAEELALLDHELVRLDARRALLLTRRARLLTQARPPAADAGARATTRPAETSGPGAQNVLLILGGLLLTIAAVAFTAVGWGHLGIGGRAAVLGTVTLAAGLAPAVLLRRRLRSTAEAVAGLALALTVLDAYALRRVALAGTDPLAYTAGAAAVLAALWAAYGLAAGRLRPPLIASVAAAQLPLVLWSVSPEVTLPPEWALLGTAAFDAVLVVRATSPLIRRCAAAGLAVTGGPALLIGAFQSLSAHSPGAAAAPAALLVTAAAVALFAARRPPALAVALSVAAGLALVTAAGGPVRTVVPAGWAVPGYLLGAVALLGAVSLPRVRAAAPRGVVPGLAGAAAAVHALALLWALPLVALALTGPLVAPPAVWSGAAPGAREALGAGLPAVYPAAVPLVVLLVAAVPLALGRRPGPWPAVPARVRGAGAVVAWGGLFAVPAAFDAGHAATVAYHLPLTVGVLAVTAVRAASREAVAVALGCGLAGAASVTALALASRPATFAVLGALLAVSAGASVVSRAGNAVRAVLGCTAVAAAAALLLAGARAADLAPHHAGLLLLAVPAVTAVLGARAARHPVGLPLEWAGASAGLLAVVLAHGRLPVLALVLSLGGVIAAGTAVRPERRRVAAPVAGVLFVLAAWARLAVSGVAVPEAYSLPVTIPALALGALRRRRDPRASSWTAYGPGLGVTMVPSLLLVWGDSHWVRPLLLGLAALAVTLVGARRRLQAPLLTGAVVLALVALHELAPYVVQVVDALPRWLPPALAGALLLAVGATYEQRLRDARRVREGLGRLR
ncbi:SCO7613 C-terminal domain-containing membrane protein [Streptomyces sp. NPDC001889]